MEYNNISSNFSANQYSDSALTTKVNTVLEKMTGNISFPNPDPALAEVKAKNDLFTLAAAKAPQGGKQETANKNQLREELVSLLKRLVIYVELTCNGDETMLLSSGFDLHKKASPVGQLPMPEGLKATVGASRGSLVLSWDVVKNARVYELMYTEAPEGAETIWIHKISSKHQIVIEGLLRGKEYLFKVAAVGSDPNLVWSDPIASFVL